MAMIRSTAVFMVLALSITEGLISVLNEGGRTIRGILPPVAHREDCATALATKRLTGDRVRRRVVTLVEAGDGEADQDRDVDREHDK